MFCKDYELPLSRVEEINRRRKVLGVDRFPLGFWSPGHVKLPRDTEHFGPDCVDLWQDGGFTFAMTPSFDAFDEEAVKTVKGILSRAEELKIKVILVPIFDRWADMEKVNRDYPPIISKLYSDFKDFSAVYGIYAIDEPHSPERHEVANRMLNLQKELAPGWVPYFNLLPYWEPVGLDICWKHQGFDCFSASLDDFIKKGDADCISYDLYHPMKVGEQGYANHFNCLRYYREAALRHGIPFMNILLSIGHFNYRCPNYDELRWQFNTSLACGVSGISWYYLYQGIHSINYRNAPIDELWEKTEAWYNVRKIQREFLSTYGDLFSKIVCYRTEFYGRAYGSDPTFCPSDIVMGIETDVMHHPLLVSYFVDEQGDKYLMIVNNTNDPEGSSKVHVTFSGDVELQYFDHGEPSKWGYICDNYTKVDGNQVCQYWLAPGQEVLVKVVSDKVRALPANVPPMVR